jgi:hypothetical protein
MVGVREWLNQHPKVAVAGGVVVAGLAIFFVVIQVLAGRHKYPTNPLMSYYTDDDGKTFFADTDDKVPPFDHNGKTAVTAYVFQCKGQKFVGYMERFTPQFHDFVVSHGRTAEAVRYGTELKRPGDANWVSCGDLKKVAQIQTVRCPDGSADEPEALLPGE